MTIYRDRRILYWRYCLDGESCLGGAVAFVYLTEKHGLVVDRIVSNSACPA